MYTKIVVPLDGSPLAEVALIYAEEIAGKMGTDIVLLSVLPTEEPEEYQNHQKYAKKIVNKTKRNVEKYLEHNGHKSINIHTATRTGNPAEGILDYAEKGYHCLIVMATHGRSGVNRWAVGSVADKVVRAAARQPVLLIRAKGAHPDVRAKRILKKMVVPLDGSTLSEVVIPHVIEMASNLKIEVTLMRVVPKTDNTFAAVEKYLRDWCQKLEEQGISTGYQVRIGSPAEQIIDYTEETASDFVAMSTRGQTSINLWALGSVAQKILLGGNTPLMLVKA